MKKMFSMALVMIATSAAAESRAAWPAWPENMYLGATFPKEQPSYPMGKTFPIGKTFSMGLYPTVH